MYFSEVSKNFLKIIKNFHVFSCRICMALCSKLPIYRTFVNWHTVYVLDWKPRGLLFASFWLPSNRFLNLPVLMWHACLGQAPLFSAGQPVYLCVALNFPLLVKFSISSCLFSSVHTDKCPWEYLADVNCYRGVVVCGVCVWYAPQNSDVGVVGHPGITDPIVHKS